MNKKKIYVTPDSSRVDLRVGDLLEGGIKVASGEEHGGFGAKHGSGSGVPTWGDESKHQYQHSVWDD